MSASNNDAAFGIIFPCRDVSDSMSEIEDVCFVR